MSAPQVPERPTLDGLEAKWSARWDESGTYRFDRQRQREEVFAIDTPPPTVSGSLHVGHVFSYSQTDVIARYQRMRGKAVFYPIGWDDNGLATERRVQNYFGVRCDPSQPYDPSFVPPESNEKEAIPISRPNFVELCRRLTAEDEKTFEELFRLLGMSFDWEYHYSTIGSLARRTSQVAFLRNLERKEAYRAEAPTLWDVDFQTAVAQAELEDREVKGAYYRLRFERADGPGGVGPGAEGGAVEIETTRPELVPACVALVTHPSDERYRHLVGTEVVTPLFGVRVPVVAHRLAEPDKGSGIAMICTFGDLTDVLWWRELGLPTRTVVERDGRLGEAPYGAKGWESEDPARAGRLYAQLRGQTVRQAQRRIAELLGTAGALVGEPRPITHPVKFYEKGERPLEIVSSRQWYMKTMAMRERLLERGRELDWLPSYMQVRYENWVEGLSGDWALSRQRFFGVPFPVWYRLGSDGEPIEDEILLPDDSQLPVDPSTDVPPGFEESDRGKAGGFAGDPDVMDTWATSSLSPQIAGRYLDDPDLFATVFPNDMRPQAHDIIRTWLFSTVVRSELENDELPWRHAAISGFILDPDRKKLGKSKGNAIVPSEPLERHGTDAVRYWATSARLGVDSAYDEQQMKVGRRLAIKILNVTRFVLSRATSPATAERPAALTPVDVSMLAMLASTVRGATEALERFDYARALEDAEAFFWRYCDDYVELVKARAYRDLSDAGSASARFALATALGAQLRLFAPYLPFATEEAWSWSHEGSVHRAPWPTEGELCGRDGDPEVLRLTGEVLRAIRKAKTQAQVSMRAPVARCAVTGTDDELAVVTLVEEDLRQVGAIDELVLEQGDGLEVTVTLAPSAPQER